MSMEERCPKDARTSRRVAIGGAVCAPLSTVAADVLADVLSSEDGPPIDYTPSFGPMGRADIPDYLSAGPFRTASVERQKHACMSCFPLCTENECLLKITITYPRNFLAGDEFHRPPFPLAIFSSGFLVESKQYLGYAERLASWGYVVLTYDKIENINSVRNDVVSACFIQELIDWASTNAALEPIIDGTRVFLCGHSRGGKTSVLAATRDPRVVAACLVDP
eukprot:CAMPEP_0118951942 /NCGR_PEP_ID=MMETSP1169-20130426/53960_1 /TAXON_ID=36882 /ORGANISM="Pyramimonas obovata, Strain CCMP722" /LENGTH=221 /DNA_ID=CAMNT_0006899089 /DNA_START=140 /DNA_END=801 /DNA_ORIENTATION=-